LRGPGARRERSETECETSRKLFVLLKLTHIRTIMYIQCSNMRRILEVKSRRGNAFRVSPTMPFAGPLTALASTINYGIEGCHRPGETARAAACQRPSTTFQPLTTRLNDLQKNEWESRCLRCCMLGPPWNPASSARPAENGIRLPWTNPPDAARATWKTARFAASRTCCASSLTTRRRNSSSLLSWSEKAEVGPQTSDLRPQTSDLRPRIPSSVCRGPRSGA
jgi:hypothetical protein